MGLDDPLKVDYAAHSKQTKRNEQDVVPLQHGGRIGELEFYSNEVATAASVKIQVCTLCVSDCARFVRWRACARACLSDRLHVRPFSLLFLARVSLTDAIQSTPRSPGSAAVQEPRRAAGGAGGRQADSGAEGAR
jgi:hypothetical protein